VLSLVLLAAISFVALTGLYGIFTSQTARIYSFALLTILLAIAYQPFKRMFEKVTSKFFYKDAYDMRVLLDEFNRAIVSSIVLDRLLERAAAAIVRFIKPQDVSFVIRNNSSELVSLVQKTRLTKEGIRHIDAYMQTVHQTLLVTDALEDEKGLKKILQKADVGVIVQMVIDKSTGHTAYIVLGYKKSGDSYNSQDADALKILANGLSIAVHNALQFEEIGKFNETLKEKIEEATRKLRRTNDKLRKLDETKDDFISMASHQLRTPLTSVKGYVSMVLDGDAGKITDLQRKLLTQSFISSQRMVYLISDLLNVSRLRTGKFIIEPMPTNLSTMIEEEIDQLQETAKGRKLTLTFNKPDHFPTMMFDETKMRQVIMNFIDNAVYYTPSGGHIEVNLVERPSTIEFTVVDDGIGVPRHEQQHLFSKFFRAHNAKRARPDGTGLGLFMAKKVIIAQGGAIVFKSQEGRGSTFGFTFAKVKLLPHSAVPTGIHSPVVATAVSTTKNV
jgi:signal transduction histidine kinase